MACVHAYKHMCICTGTLIMTRAACILVCTSMHLSIHLCMHACHVLWWVCAYFHTNTCMTLMHAQIRRCGKELDAQLEPLLSLMKEAARNADIQPHGPGGETRREGKEGSAHAHAQATSEVDEDLGFYQVGVCVLSVTTRWRQAVHAMRATAAEHDLARIHEYTGGTRGADALSNIKIFRSHVCMYVCRHV
jgi:hypothetical protein